MPRTGTGINPLLQNQNISKQNNIPYVPIHATKNLSTRKLLHKKDPKVEDCFEAAGGCCLPGPVHVAPWVSSLWPWWRAEHTWLAWFIHMLLGVAVPLCACTLPAFFRFLRMHFVLPPTFLYARRGSGQRLHPQEAALEAAGLVASLSSWGGTGAGCRKPFLLLLRLHGERWISAIFKYGYFLSW